MSNQDKKHTQNFKSPSTGQLCTLPQYIAEVICIRKAEKANKGMLAFKFWNKKQKTEYQAQIVCANRLIDKYGQNAVLSFIQNNKHIYSLGFYQPHKFVDELVKKELDAINNKIVEDKKPEEIKEKPTNIKPKKIIVKKNLFSQIKGIEDGKN